MNEVQVSKFMSLALRHEPQALGIELDQNGWTDFRIFAEKMHAKFGVSEAKLIHLIETNPKKRFIVTGRKIRANQGHSVEIDIALAAVVPPDFLYHGTTENAWTSIQSSGLLKQSRNHVHLSADEVTAKIVAIRRRGPWVILQVASGVLHKTGIAFFKSENDVWLTDHVAPSHIHRLKSWS
jgi:putative RNA 2'-phosphotransferase